MQVRNQPSNRTPCIQAKLLRDPGRENISDEDITTYFFRLLTSEQSGQLFSQVGDLGAPPLERLLRCGISM